MKGLKAFCTATLILSSLNSYAINSISLVGTFENNEGCRVFNAQCFKLDSSNTCQFEVYKNGTYLGEIGKAGKIKSFDANHISATNIGLRSGMGLPTFSHQTAEFKIKRAFNNPDYYTDLDVYEFDLKLTNGLKTINCKNLIRSNNY